MENSATITPKKLADELHMSDKRIRAWLRESATRPLVEKGARWYLTQDEADRVRRPFS